ncbi:MAG: hypothetical protein JXB62_12720 [Pirellulales bacterium]|nr:hypothetical protein [Pirellulales bacterium]
MRFVWLTLAVYLAAVAETSLIDVLRIGEVTPDLLALVAVVWLLTSGSPRAFLGAGAVALVGDLIAPGHLGVGMGWMLLAGYGVGRLRARFRLEHLGWQVLITFATVAAWAAAVGATGRLIGDLSLAWSAVVPRALGVGLYTAAVALPVWMVVGWIRQPFLARKRRLAEF